MFTSTDNTVVLPAFTRVDAALFMTVTRQLRAQLNMENLLDERYYPFSNGNNNITPGSPRALRLSLTTNF
jgi:catecholate siderophore receptor